MAEFLKRWKKFMISPLGQLLELTAYAVMLVLVLIYFTGNGVFIYEAF